MPDDDKYLSLLSGLIIGHYVQFDVIPWTGIGTISAGIAFLRVDNRCIWWNGKSAVITFIVALPNVLYYPRVSGVYPIRLLNSYLY